MREMHINGDQKKKKRKKKPRQAIASVILLGNKDVENRKPCTMVVGIQIGTATREQYAHSSKN